MVDNFFTGRKRNVEHWIGHENFELINHDIVNPLFIEGEKENPKNFQIIPNNRTNYLNVKKGKK